MSMESRKDSWKWNPEIDRLLEIYQSKFCECGCGKRLHPTRKQVRDNKYKNKPLRVLKGHHNKLPEAIWIRKGKEHPFFGKHHSPESIKKMSETWFKKLSHRKSREDLLHRRGWEPIRNQVLLRDKYKCLKCGKSIKEIRIDIHHIINRKSFISRLKANSLDNLISLCEKCHSILENILRKQVKTGRIAGKSRTDNQQPSQEITRKFLEGSTVRIEIISTSTPPARDDMT